MVKYCAAVNCNNKFFKGTNIHFYKFPLRKPALLKKWLKALGRPNYMPSVHHFLCSDHFTPESFLANTINKKSLTDDAVPTIFHDIEGFMAIKVETNEPPPQKPRTTTMVTRRMSRKETGPRPGGSRSTDFVTESELDQYFNGQVIEEDNRTTKQDTRTGGISSLIASDSDSVNEEGIDNDHKYDSSYTPPRTPHKIKQDNSRRATPTTLIVSDSESSDDEEIENNNRYDDPFTRRPTPSRLVKMMKKNRLRVKRTKHKEILKELVSVKRKFKRKFNKKNVKMFISLPELMNLLKQKTLISEEAVSILSEGFSGLSLEIFRTVSPNAKFSDVLESFATTLHFHSPTAYEYVLKSLKLCLPTVTSLRNIYKSVNGMPGFTSEAFQAIRHRAHKANRPIYVALLFDEMSIGKKIEWDGDCFFGAVNMGKGVEPDTDTEAREVLVIMAVAINASWKIPIAYFLINGLAPDIKANLINESIARLHEAGVHVKSVTSVGLQTNMTTYNKLGATYDKADRNPSFENPVTNEKVYTLFDACYMIKLIRHILCNNKVLIDHDGTYIKWLYIERLQNLQETEMLKLAKKLKKTCVNYCGEKMKEKLAPQLLSASVGKALLFLANDLKHPDFEGAEGTANFCFVLDKLFDVCNSKNWLAKDYKAAMSKDNKCKWLPFLDDAENYLTKLADSDGRLLINSGKKTIILGLVWTIRGIRGLFQDLVESRKLKYLITYKFSQDHLELFFCMIRSLLGWDYNPPAFKFKVAYKTLLVKDKLKNDNTGTSDEQVDVPLLSLEQENDVRASGVEMDPFIFCTARRNGNTDFEDLATVIDDDYIALPPNLSEYSSKVVFYLAGFVARRITSQVNCEICCDALIEEEITNPSHVDFFARENNGVYVIPSKDVITVCNLLEHEIRVRQLSADEKCPNISPLEIRRNVMETIKDLNIFVELSDHFLDNIFPENHLIRLVILISKLYVKLRCHYGRSSSIESMVIF